MTIEVDLESRGAGAPWEEATSSPLLPNPDNAAALTTEINRRLVSSLRYVFGEVGEQLGCEPAEIETWIKAIEAAGRPDPLVHVLFHSLVAELQAGDFGKAQTLLPLLFNQGGAQQGLQIRTAEDEAGGARPVALFSRFADLEDANRLDLIAPDPQAVARVTELIEQGLELIARNDPALDGEFRAFVSEILLVAQRPEHRFTLAAASCFQNWGALLVNPAVQRDALDIVELFAHEATHLLLFALALDEPLVTNPPEELHYSPLREAPRSMDGVYHATIVSARVVRALLEQAEAPGASAELQEIARERAERAARTYEDGVAIIEAKGKLTPLGRQLLEESAVFVTPLRGPRL